MIVNGSTKFKKGDLVSGTKIGGSVVCGKFYSQLSPNCYMVTVNGVNIFASNLKLVPQTIADVIEKADTIRKKGAVPSARKISFLEKRLEQLMSLTITDEVAEKIGFTLEKLRECKTSMDKLPF